MPFSKTFVAFVACLMGVVAADDSQDWEARFFVDHSSNCPTDGTQTPMTGTGPSGCRNFQFGSALVLNPVYPNFNLIIYPEADCGGQGIEDKGAGDVGEYCLVASSGGDSFSWEVVAA